jgi:succinoglycan biosynthesis protein ExoA
MADTTVLASVNAAAGQGHAEGRSVLVAIPAYDEAAHIEACIRSLMTGDERLNDVAFVVVDGLSKDATAKIVNGLRDEFPNLSLISNPKRLQSAAINLAAREAGQGRSVLVRCDAHSIYPANYVMAVADSLVGRGVASVVVPMDAVGKSGFQLANAWIVDSPLGSGGSAHRGGRKSMFVDHGHHAGFDLAKFIEVGGYDETFSHNEDAEFDTRLRAAGGQIFLDADIRLAYFPRARAGALAKQYFNYGKGRARTILKHGEKPKLRQLIPPATLVACTAGLAAAPFTLWALILPGGYLAALAAASVGVAVNKKSPVGLMAGPASAIMHMSWSAGFFRQMAKGQR